jgi:hypothetical protein
VDVSQSSTRAKLIDCVRDLEGENRLLQTTNKRLWEELEQLKRKDQAATSSLQDQLPTGPAPTQPQQIQSSDPTDKQLTAAKVPTAETIVHVGKKRKLAEMLTSKATFTEPEVIMPASSSEAQPKILRKSSQEADEMDLDDVEARKACEQESNRNASAKEEEYDSDDAFLRLAYEAYFDGHPCANNYNDDPITEMEDSVYSHFEVYVSSESSDVDAP